VAKSSSQNKKASKVRSWDEQVDRFAAYLDTAEMSRMTVKGYRVDLKSFAAWHREVTREEPSAEGTTATILLECKRALIERGLKPPTVNRRLAAIKSFLVWAQKDGQIEDLPQVPRHVRKMREELKWLDRREQLALIRTVERSGRTRDRAIVLILINTGLRVGELVALEWRDIEISERKGLLTVRSGKGAKWRTIPLNATAREAFTALNKMAVLTGGRNRVFQGPRGPIGTRAVQHMLDRYAPAAKIPNLTPHMLRHTFCKNLVNAGVGLPEIARLAGHESILVTQRYVTPSGGDLERAMDRLGADDPAR